MRKINKTSAKANMYGRKLWGIVGGFGAEWGLFKVLLFGERESGVF
jgi:hypothetical protein